MVTLKVKRIKEGARLPCYAHKGDAGMDIFSNEDHLLMPQERYLFSTGISTEFDEGYVALIWDKSGLAAKKGIKTMAGVVDCGYRGEWKILLFNTSDEPFEVKRGDKIAQCLVQPVESCTIEEVFETSSTSRGDGGFGSTGTR